MATNFILEQNRFIEKLGMACVIAGGSAGIAGLLTQLAISQTLGLNSPDGMAAVGSGHFAGLVGGSTAASLMAFGKKSNTDAITYGTLVTTLIGISFAFGGFNLPHVIDQTTRWIVLGGFCIGMIGALTKTILPSRHGRD